ncbi:hypothetical protein C8R43DRAFT_945905 [Mycena crocata]|nr:hypothetical protein C8R43DRAFT_945905 [Mycena crocata]
MRPLLATLLLAVNVMASPTGTPLIPLFDGIITDSLAVGATTSVVHQSNVQHAVPTSVPGVVRVASSPPLITSVPTKLPFSEGTNMTLQRSTPLSSLTTPSSVVPVIVLMESGDSTLSGRDIAAIVIGFILSPTQPSSWLFTLPYSAYGANTAAADGAPRPASRLHHRARMRASRSVSRARQSNLAHRQQIDALDTSLLSTLCIDTMGLFPLLFSFGLQLHQTLQLNTITVYPSATPTIYFFLHLDFPKRQNLFIFLSAFIYAGGTGPSGIVFSRTHLQLCNMSGCHEKGKGGKSSRRRERREALAKYEQALPHSIAFLADAHGYDCKLPSLHARLNGRLLA